MTFTLNSRADFTLEAARTHVPVDRQDPMLGPATAELAEWLRGRVYGA